jgi:hypothetical protein
LHSSQQGTPGSRRWDEKQAGLKPQRHNKKELNARFVGVVKRAAFQSLGFSVSETLLAGTMS